MKLRIFTPIIACLVTFSAEAAPQGLILYADNPEVPLEKVECLEFERIEKLSDGYRVFIHTGYIPSRRLPIHISSYRLRGLMHYKDQLVQPGDEEFQKILELYEETAAASPAAGKFLYPKTIRMRRHLLPQQDMQVRPPKMEKPAQEPLPNGVDLTFPDGLTLRNCRVSKTEGDSVHIIHSDGIKRYEISTLDENTVKLLKLKPASPAPAAVAREGVDYFQWRSWTVAGKPVSAQLESWVNDRMHVTLRAAGGKRIEMIVDEMGAADRAFVRAAMGAADEDALKREPLLETAPIFKPVGFPDRMKIPSIDHREYGQKGADAFPASFTNFVLWWDQEGVLPIKLEGRFERKVEWVQTWLGRYCGTRNTVGTRMDDAIQGFGKYFDENLAERAAFKRHVTYDISPESLSRYPIGWNATLLTLGFRVNRDTYSQTVSLISASPDGAIVFAFNGIIAQGRIVMLEKKDNSITRRFGIHGATQEINATTYEIKPDSELKLPNYLKGSTIVLDPAFRHKLVVLKPYIFAEEGKKCRAPDDPLFPLAK